MLEIRIHGRGGQGNVVAAYLLATTAIEQGRYGQAFPAFGAERRGAPVVAFVRIDDKPILRRCQVQTPGFLIIQDHALLHVPGVTSGLSAQGGILVNAPGEEALAGFEASRVVSIPATRLAQEHLGRPVPNTALLSAFLTLTGLLTVEQLVDSLGHRFKGEVLERNAELVRAAARWVEPGIWAEAAHASRA